MGNKVLVEGHRGYAAKYPENTMISFAAALELGVDAIEFDVWLSKDKVPVLMHDGNPNRTCGYNSHLRNMTLEEIKKLDASYEAKFGDKYQGHGITVPTLEELLSFCRENYPNIILGVEIKEYTEENVDITVELLRKYGFFDTCYFYAFNGRIVKYVREKYNGRIMGYPDFQMQEYSSDTYSYYYELGVALNFVKSEIFPLLSAKGLPMHMYCADNEEDVKLCIERGASLITANDPEPALKLLGRL